MASLRFEWDERKNRMNRRQYGVTLEEAKTVFADENGLLIDDPEHSTAEERFILLGLSADPRLLVVCHCYRHDGDVIRIISARRANRKERGVYATSWNQ